MEVRRHSYDLNTSYALKASLFLKAWGRGSFIISVKIPHIKCSWLLWRRYCSRGSYLCLLQVAHFKAIPIFSLPHPLKIPRQELTLQVQLTSAQAFPLLVAAMEAIRVVSR